MNPKPAPQAKHPLEPLHPAEIEEAVAIVKKEKALGRFDRFVSVMLKEPSKSVVLEYDGKTPIERQAAIVLLNNAANAVFEAVVSLAERKVVSWKHVPGVQPTIMLDEQIECEEAVKRSPLFLEALARTGDFDPSLVMVDLWSVGHFGAEEENELRLARPLCFLRADAKENGYARPLGIMPVVDLNRMEVIRVEEAAYPSIPPKPAHYTPDRVGPLRSDIKPISITQPEGPGFTLDGHRLRWQSWDMNVGFNSREGLVIHTVSYDDRGVKRPVLYRGALSEMVVPYGDPSPSQNRKNAFDSGEYGIGQLANSLELGCDCVGYIQYLDAAMTNSKGEVAVIKNAICIHEEDYGILWKHTDWRTNEVEVRRSRRLVVSSISTVANYEYGFFWYFYQDGNIEFQIKLTGILSVGCLEEGSKPIYGTMIAPELYAPNHQHFFNVRLDFQIDGMNNTVYEVDTLAGAPGPDNPMNNSFYAQATKLATEREAIRDFKFETARFWKIVNDNVKNGMNASVGYKIVPGENCFPFAASQSSVMKRAGFAQHHLWVTPFDENEMYAAGNYPNQHPGGDGLAGWTQRDRSVDNTDIVVWYTMGHNHIPRPEDWPVMPAAYIGFLLKPVGFFGANPAINLPPSAKKSGSCSASASSCHPQAGHG